MTRKLGDGTNIKDIRRKKRFRGLGEVFEGVSQKMSQDFIASYSINHSGDEGEEREEFLKEFLSSEYFPSKYRVSKGHGKVVNTLGQTSLQTDIVIYDSTNCPVLRDGKNHQFFPVESVYATIQVKSKLSKKALEEAVANVASVKRLSPYRVIELGKNFYSGGGFVRGEVAPIPFGAIFAYDLGDNSLSSLEDNLREICSKRDPIEWPNVVCVLNRGIFYHLFDSKRIYDSRKIIDSVKAGKNHFFNALHSEEDSLKDFYFMLIGAMGMMELPPPPLHEYLELPLVTKSGYSFKVGGMLAALKCEKHGCYEPVIKDEWAKRLSDFIQKGAKLYKPSEYILASIGAPVKVEGFNLDEFKEDAYIYFENSDNPLELIKMQKNSSGHPVQMYLEVYINGELILVPGKYYEKESIFEECFEC